MGASAQDGGKMSLISWTQEQHQQQQQDAIPCGQEEFETLGVPTKTMLAHEENLNEWCSTPEDTILFFDWDDTLFPSNWLQQSDGFFRPLSETNSELFKKLGERLEAVLKLAMSLGKVVIVTNSSEPWISISVRTFMPYLSPLIKEIKVIYARSLYEITPGSDASAIKDPTALQADAMAPQRWKEQAFLHQIGSFYSRYENQTWKNVICIGDSIYERDAAKNVVNGCGKSKGCRLKTAKFLENPDASDIVTELHLLHDALSALVQYDGNMDVEIDPEDLKHGLSLASKVEAWSFHNQTAS